MMTQEEVDRWEDVRSAVDTNSEALSDLLGAIRDELARANRLKHYELEEGMTLDQRASLDAAWAGVDGAVGFDNG